MSPMAAISVLPSERQSVASPDPMPPAPMRAKRILSFGDAISAFHLALGGVPGEGPFFEVAPVAQQGRAGRSQSEEGVLDYGFAGANGGQEVAVVVLVVAVVAGGAVGVFGLRHH